MILFLSIHAKVFSRCIISFSVWSEGHGLLVELVEVLVVDARILELLYFSCLDILDFVPLVIDFLSNFSAFFQEVQSILFFDILIGGNLSSDLVRVVN